jgi:hypothetical protein
VRLIRYVTVLFTIISFLWWAVQLVTVFVTPPGLHTRGSGFLAFTFASVAFANLLFTLVFFAVPSRAARILLGFMAVCILLSLLIVTANALGGYRFPLY